MASGGGSTRRRAVPRRVPLWGEDATGVLGGYLPTAGPSQRGCAEGVFGDTYPPLGCPKAGASLGEDAIDVLGGIFQTATGAFSAG